MTGEKKPAAPGSTAGHQHQHKPTTAHAGEIVPQRPDGGKLALVICKDEPRIDSRLLAQHFGRPHQSLFEMVKDYRADFEALGLLLLQTAYLRLISRARYHNALAVAPDHRLPGWRQDRLPVAQTHRDMSHPIHRTPQTDEFFDRADQPHAADAGVAQTGFHGSPGFG